MSLLFNDKEKRIRYRNKGVWRYNLRDFSLTNHFRNESSDITARVPHP